MRARRMTSLLAAALLVVALGACSDDGKDEPKSSPSTSSGTPGETTSGSADPTSSGPTEVEPATGPLVTLHSTATLRLPASVKWRTYGDKTTVVTIKSVDFAPGTEKFYYVDVTEFPQIDDNLARMAELARESQEGTREIPLKVGANRTIAGVEGFVLEGQGPNGQFYEWGGLDADNVLTTVAFVVPNGLDLEEWVEPVLASLQWQ
ncbi:hypothetical protein [Nocardioides sp. LML1-1-1.1]|uniref:hypothetical protein n=1 Tax=Nocardioides sp. LML1-1-1.1 TaxID=3135248 RepID=UPI00343E38A7